METAYRRRRLILMSVVLVGVVVALLLSGTLHFNSGSNTVVTQPSSTTSSPALAALATLAIKGRAPKTDYSRAQFGDGWTTTAGCDTREIILHRDLTNDLIDPSCNVTKGTLDDPYTGKMIQFVRGSNTSAAVQIDHVVALSDAWQTGAQLLPKTTRIALANDPLELLAVDGPANQQKSDGDAATWLPPNKSFRCQYVARQIAVKQKYSLWVTQAEHDAMQNILSTCPNQPLPAK